MIVLIVVAIIALVSGFAFGLVIVGNRADQAMIKAIEDEGMTFREYEAAEFNKYGYHSEASSKSIAKEATRSKL